MRRAALLAAMIAMAASAFGAERSENFQHSFPASAGKVVLVDVGPLDLTLRVAEIPDIRVKVELVAGAFSEAQAQAWIDARKPTLEDSDRELRITAPNPRGLSLLKGVVITRARVELTVPPGVLPDLSTSSGNIRAEGELPQSKPLRLRTSSGDIEFVGWVPEIEARATSGNLQLKATRAINVLLARTASGEVSFSGGVHRTRCDTSSGSITLEGLLGPAILASSSGSVTARFDAAADSDEIQVTTASGRVRLVLPPGAHPAGQITTTGGEIHSVYPGQADPASGTLVLSGSGPKLSVTTSSGKVELQ